MNRPPRAVDRPILTGFGIWRVVFVGLGLLAVTLWAFFWMKSHGASVQLARIVAVNMITIGQMFYLLNSRYLLDSFRPADRSHRPGGTAHARAAGGSR